MKESKDLYEIEILDVLNEVGGAMVIDFHTATIKLTKEQLQKLRDGGYNTDVISCVIAGLAGSGMNSDQAMEFIREADAAGAAPNVTFEAAEGETLNITSPEENPMVDALVQAVSNQGKEG